MHTFFLCEISFRFFVAHDGVEPSMILAKRELRPAVIRNKSHVNSHSFNAATSIKERAFDIYDPLLKPLPQTHFERL